MKIRARWTGTQWRVVGTFREEDRRAPEKDARWLEAARQMRAHPNPMYQGIGSIALYDREALQATLAEW